MDEQYHRDGLIGYLPNPLCRFALGAPLRLDAGKSLLVAARYLLFSS